jgi:hypothetical protein
VLDSWACNEGRPTSMAAAPAPDEVSGGAQPAVDCMNAGCMLLVVHICTWTFKLSHASMLHVVRTWLRSMCSTTHVTGLFACVTTCVTTCALICHPVHHTAAQQPPGPVPLQPMLPDTPAHGGSQAEPKALQASGCHTVHMAGQPRPAEASCVQVVLALQHGAAERRRYKPCMSALSRT